MVKRESEVWNDKGVKPPESGEDIQGGKEYPADWMDWVLWATTKDIKTLADALGELSEIKNVTQIKLGKKSERAETPPENGIVFFELDTQKIWISHDNKWQSFGGEHEFSNLKDVVGSPVKTGDAPFRITKGQSQQFYKGGEEKFAWEWKDGAFSLVDKVASKGLVELKSGGSPDFPNGASFRANLRMKKGTSIVDPDGSKVLYNGSSKNIFYNDGGNKAVIADHSNALRLISRKLNSGREENLTVTNIVEGGNDFEVLRYHPREKRGEWVFKKSDISVKEGKIDIESPKSKPQTVLSLDKNDIEDVRHISGRKKPFIDFAANFGEKNNSIRYNVDTGEHKFKVGDVWSFIVRSGKIMMNNKLRMNDKDIQQIKKAHANEFIERGASVAI